MRLLHLTQSYYPFLEKGGPTVKVRALALGLVRLRVDMEDRGGRTELLLPYSTLEPIR